MPQQPKRKPRKPFTQDEAFRLFQRSLVSAMECADDGDWITALQFVRNGLGVAIDRLFEVMRYEK